MNSVHQDRASTAVTGLSPSLQEEKLRKQAASTGPQSPGRGEESRVRKGRDAAE